jgi:hypothetical protein
VLPRYLRPQFAHKRRGLVGKVVSEALNALAQRELDKVLQAVGEFHPSGVESRYTGNSAPF